MLTIEIVKGGMIFDTLADEWDQLLSNSPFGTPFQSRLWLKTWSSHFGRIASIRTVVVREGADLVGIFPMTKVTSPWRAIRPLGVGPSDYLAPLIVNSSDSILGAMNEALSTLSKTHLVDLHQVPSDHPFAYQSQQFDQIDQAKCLVLDLPSSFEAYVAGLSKSLRYDVRRLEGKALKEKGASVEWATTDSIEEFADQFFDLHKARWKSRGLPGAFFGKGERFQRNWLRHAIADGTILMNRLVSEGKPVGIVYAMQHRSTCYFYQAGMDPDASSLSPGTILVSKMIERAIDQGCDTFDFMRGDEPYKRRWKPNRERTNLRILMASGNVVAKTGTWWNHTAWRVELKVRERLEGKSLRPSKSPK